MYRTRTHHYEYLKYLADRRKQNKLPTEHCILCEIDKADHSFVSQSKYFKIVRNRFPYAVWDFQRVSDHLMVVPRTHTDSLASLSKEARLEFVELISEYESHGYHVYARATHSDTKSIAHQHTHLIKCYGPTSKLAFYILKPYVSISL
ncbi:MAG: HIT family protein [Candidatus Saccharimonadales bacterium]|jgi:diadenosine tetraphosphate (Ap4A) HIT family hydrolase